MLRHLPDRGARRCRLVVTSTPHDHLDQYGRESEPLCRKSVNQAPGISCIAPLLDDALRFQAPQTVRQDVGGDSFPPARKSLYVVRPLKMRSRTMRSDQRSPPVGKRLHRLLA